jgi:hypothetical protein
VVHGVGQFQPSTPSKKRVIPHECRGAGSMNAFVGQNNTPLRLRLCHSQSSSEPDSNAN